MRVAVVGAGLSGLACARSCQQAGAEVVVFEKSRGFGGRAAYKRVGPWTFDTGATVLSSRPSLLHDFLIEHGKGVGQLVEWPIWLHDGQRAWQERPAEPRWVFPEGISALAKKLAEGLDGRLQTLVSQVQETSGRWRVEGSEFDRLVLSAPLPQSRAILEASGIDCSWPEGDWQPQFAVLLGFEKALDLPWNSVLDPTGGQPLVWASVETKKRPGPGTAFTLQLSEGFTRERYESPANEVIEAALALLNRLLSQGLGEPQEAAVHRWRYSRITQPLSRTSCGPLPPGVILTGDAFTGSKLELAYEEGLRAAEEALA